MSTRLRALLAPTESAATSTELPPTPEQDELLLAALRAGDAEAKAALHRRTQALVRRTVQRLLGRNDHEADDVAQLAFIELLRTIAGFRGIGPLDAWVRVVSSRIVYRHIRRRRLDRNLIDLLPPEAISGTSDVTRRELALRDALRRIQRHLLRVDENRSLTFLLHDVYGYNMREVASITGVSVAAAKSRLKRGRLEVQERVQADPELAGVARELSAPQHAP